MSERAFFWVGVLLFSSVGRKFRGCERKGVKWGSPNNIFVHRGIRGGLFIMGWLAGVVNDVWRMPRATTSEEEHPPNLLCVKRKFQARI